MTTDLTPDAVAVLWPFLQLFAAVVAALMAIAGGLWAGFRWLEERIEAVAARMLGPLVERVALLERDVAACHRRLDEWVGHRPP